MGNAEKGDGAGLETAGAKAENGDGVETAGAKVENENGDGLETGASGADAGASFWWRGIL